jgi:hypothetical protein
VHLSNLYECSLSKTYEKDRAAASSVKNRLDSSMNSLGSQASNQESSIQKNTEDKSINE